MEERIQNCARQVVLRALGFATLAIGTVMVGLSSDPALALITGAVLTALTGAVLLQKALTAATRDYRRTEVWMILDKRHDLREDRAQELIGSTLAKLYRKSAGYVLLVAVGQWLLSVAARLV